MPRRPITDESEIPTLFDSSNRKKSHKCTESEIELRRLEVARQRLRGKSIVEIANDMNYSEVTIKNDLDAVYEARKEYLTQFSQVDFVNQSLAIFQELERRAFNQMDFIPAGDSRHSKFINDIRNTRQSMIGLLQDAGLVRKESPEVKVNVTMEVLNGWSPKQIDIVSESILDAAIVSEEAELVEEENLYEKAKKESESFSDDELAEFLDED